MSRFSGAANPIRPRGSGGGRLMAGPDDSPRRTRPLIRVVDDDAGLRESFRLILDGEFEIPISSAARWRQPADGARDKVAVRASRMSSKRRELQRWLSAPMWYRPCAE